MITVYSVLKESGIKFTRDDSVVLGHKVSFVYFRKHGKYAPRIKQKEGNRICEVRAYDESFKDHIELIITNYFAKVERPALGAGHQ